ncbi:transporter [Klebsiella sp. GG_Kp154]|uniref:transporter n=1 Tax=unclassified Klebsiella TaxID=2608929 RepID=UPI0032B4D721
MNKRILSMLLSQGFGLAINVIEKLLIVPLFIHSWGLVKFGEWILIRTLPNLLLTTDVGIASHAGNAISVAIIKKENNTAAHVIKLSLYLIFALFSIIFVFGVSQFFFDLRSFLGINDSNLHLITYSVFFMSLHAGMILCSQILCSLGRATERYHIYNALAQFTRFLEIVFVCIVLITGGDIVEASIAYLLARLIVITIMVSLLMKQLKFIKSEIASAKVTLSQFFSFIKQSIPYAGIPFSQAVFLQGSSVIISSFYGPAVLAFVTVIRNTSRFMVMFSSLLGKSIWAELSRLWAEEKFKQFNRVFLKFNFVNIFILSVAFLILIFGYGYFCQWFQLKDVATRQDYILYLVVSLHSLLIAISYYNSVSLLSTERHQKYAKIIMINSILTTAIFWLLSIYFDSLTWAYVLAFCISEFGIALWLLLISLNKNYLRERDN